jgi:hypothetical protein
MQEFKYVLCATTKIKFVGWEVSSTFSTKKRGFNSASGPQTHLHQFSWHETYTNNGAEATISKHKMSNAAFLAQ